MRSSKRSTLSDLLHPSERDRVAELVQLLDHELDAPSAVLTQPSHALLERRVVRVDEIREHVHIAPLRFGVQLRRWDDAHSEPHTLGGSLSHARQGVVI